MENYLHQASVSERAPGAPQGDTDFGGESDVPAGLDLTKATGNAQLGRDVYRSWKRHQAALEGRPTDDYIQQEGEINPDAFTFIGDLAKEVYSEANPDIFSRVGEQIDDAGNKQVHFQLTPKGANILNGVSKANPELYSTQEVKPLNAISDTAQPVYEAKTQVRGVTTKVGDLKDPRLIEEAKKNYHSVKYVNDPQRMNIAMKYGLAALLNNGKDNVYANMFEIGGERVDAIGGRLDQLKSELSRETNPKKAKKLQDNINSYDPKQIFAQDRMKFLKVLGSLAQNNNKANHLTFAMQGLTGRIHMQQTLYNPQSHKAVRFVVGGGNTLQWTPGKGILDQNFREVMASYFLVDDKGTKGKDLTTSERLKLFEQRLSTGELNTLAAMGREIKTDLAAFDNAQAISLFQQLHAATDPNQVAQIKQQLAQLGQPNLSESTVNELKKHEEEGPVFAEALSELASYVDAMKNGTSMKSTITVEMDGKTHGPATNAAQLGIKEMAERTGLIRTQDYKLTDELDSRLAMGEYMRDTVGAFEGTLYPAEKVNGFTALINLATQDRKNFLKKAPMTMGYGQELGSLKGHVETTVFTGDKSNEIRALLKDEKIADKDAVEFLHTMLVNSIFEIMDAKVVDSARLLRANNLVATMTDEVLYMDNAAGFRSYAAAKQHIAEKDEAAEYRFQKDGKTAKRRAQFYRSEAAGSAVRSYGEGEGAVPGGFGHGRVIPISVQSYDGNMIARTGTGQSWDTIKNKAKGRGASNPFVLPIFDAFKTDLASFDSVREESNKNWVNGLKNHSYITEIMGTWFEETRQKVKRDFDAKDPNEVVAVNPDTKWRGVHWLFNEFNDQGQPMMQYMIKKTMAVPPKKEEQTIAEYQMSIGLVAGGAMKNIYKKMDHHGIPKQFEQLTNQQLRVLINIVMSELNVGGRNKQMIGRITKDKNELFKKFAAQGRGARQVDIA